MPAKHPEEICHLFQHAMAEGDLDAVLSVYDPEAVFVNQSRDVTKGREGLRQALAPLAARRAPVDFTIKQIIGPVTSP
jgi:ketosteroid isomerase-like protein